MSTQQTDTSISGGFFEQLIPMLAERTVMLVVTKADEQHLSVSVIPKRMKDGENTALLTPLCCTGTAQELDRELPAQLREFVAGHVKLANNLADIQRERDEAEKAAREEAKRKQKTIGSGTKKTAEPATPIGAVNKAEPERTPALTLFDQDEPATAPTPAQPTTTAESVAAHN
jgi:PRTRC genetic system protein E